jgi:hypothetical protein
MPYLAIRRMKKRASIEKAGWSKTREVWYKTECESILAARRQQIVIEEKNVVLISHEGKSILMQIEKLKTMWYDVWLRLKSA